MSPNTLEETLYDYFGQRRRAIVRGCLSQDNWQAFSNAEIAAYNCFADAYTREMHRLEPAVIEAFYSRKTLSRNPEK